MKFSIIIPVYNVQDYIDKCLSSVENQTYGNYEVIIVNDGSKDGSQKIIDKFVSKDKRFISFIKTNGGLSDARNYGVKKANGDYILFLDSDDYFESRLLEKINAKIKKNNEPDLVKFSCQTVNSHGKVLHKYISKPFCNELKLNAIKSIFTDEMIEPAWLYAYKRDFFIKNRFMYSKGKYHEDFGLTPFIIMKAEKIISIDYIGLNYVQRDGSIINCNDEQKNRKKAFDFLELYLNEVSIINQIKGLNEEKDIVKIFLTDSVVRKTNILSGQTKKDYVKLLKKNKIYKNIPQNSIKRFIKKICLFFNYKLYLIITSK